MRVFICSPFRGSTPEEQEANVAQAREFLGHAVRHGMAPFAPHLLYPGALNDAIPVERENGIRAGCQFLLACNELWWLSTERGVTTGMRKELELASIAGLVIRKFERVTYVAPDGTETEGFGTNGRPDLTWQGL